MMGAVGRSAEPPLGGCLWIDREGVGWLSALHVLVCYAASGLGFEWVLTGKE